MMARLRAAFETGQGLYCYFAGWYQDAVWHFERALELDATSPVTDYLENSRRRLTTASENQGSDGHKTDV
jgi:hypothetical protein